MSLSDLIRKYLSDAVRKEVKYQVVSRWILVSFLCGFVALLLDDRAGSNADPLGHRLDIIFCWIAAAGCLFYLVRSVWAGLQIWQQDHALDKKLRDNPVPNTDFEGTDDAVDRLSGKR